MATYRLSAPYERPPLRRRVSGLTLALVVNLLLVLVLLGIGKFTPGAHKHSDTIVVQMLPESQSASPAPAAKAAKPLQRAEAKPPPVPRPPEVVIPSKPTIAQPRAPAWVEMSKDEMASADIRNLGKSGEGSGASGDSEQVGHAPNGDVLYNAEWARRPTHAELNGYLPPNAPDGYGMIACKTIPDNRVDDCVVVSQYPLGSHLAGAVLNAAWQFHVRPPRKNGHPLIGSWVRIRIDYEGIERPDRSAGL